MQVGLAQLQQRSEAVAQTIADVRSARNLVSRRKRAERQEERAAEGARRRRKRLADREADAALKRRIRVRVPEADRPRTGGKTPRRLYHRMIEQMLAGTTGLTDARGPDRLYSIHYSFTARGLASQTGRRWRTGKAERAALYAVREDALEGGELGWWSNVACDRDELVAHYRALEALERHDRANANVYVVEVIALPAELTARQRRRAVKRICLRLEKRGLGYTVGIHLPDAAGDQRNFHLHLVYSTRPCRRVAPYEWEFAAAKQTDINTPEGIRARRCAVVRDINATPHAANIDERYTPLSHRERGMAPPVQGKIGQQATWPARRLAAAEDRKVRLVALGEKVTMLRDGLTDASARLAATRSKVARRYAGLAARVQGVSALGAALSATRVRVLDVLDRRTQAVAHVKTAGHRTALVQSAVQHGPRSMVSRTGNAADPTTIPGRRARVADVLILISSRLSTTVEAGSARLDAARRRSVAAEWESVERTIDGADLSLREPTTTPATAAPDKAARVDLMTAARNAVAARHRELCEMALSRLKTRRAGIRRHADGRYAVVLAGLPDAERQALLRPEYDVTLQERLQELFALQTAPPFVMSDAPITDRPLPPWGSPSLPPATATHADSHHLHSKENENGRRDVDQAQDQAVPRRPRGLRALGGLAGLRVLLEIPTDNRPSEANGVLRQIRRDDLRGGGPVHLPVRGPRADCVTDVQVEAPTPLSHQASPDTTRSKPKGLFAQA